MTRLIVEDVTYLGEAGGTHPPVHGLVLAVGRRRVSVHRPLRKLLSVSWPTLDSLYILTPDDVDRKLRGGHLAFTPLLLHLHDVLMPGDSGSVVALGMPGTTTWLYIKHTPVARLRAQLASWMFSTPQVRRQLRRTALPPATGDLGTYALEQALRAINTWKAEGLRIDEPVRDRKTLLYRLSVARQHQDRGQHDAAIALLLPLADHSSRAYGPADECTVATRNNLAYSLAVTGHRGEAIALYWEILDDLAAANSYTSKAETFARQNLARLHNPGWSP
ncbi:hypothetical protein ACIBO5_56450 [Nonomuraea angiospora]|uniref:hypothetical protein n=1 Tax=Nonomuraea angiospora TaxID=46172 RepID=UPI003787D61E